MIDEAPETFNTLLKILKTGSVQQILFRISLPVPKFELPKFPVPAKNTAGAWPMPPDSYSLIQPNREG